MDGEKKLGESWQNLLIRLFDERKWQGCWESKFKFLMKKNGRWADRITRGEYDKNRRVWIQSKVVWEKWHMLNKNREDLLKTVQEKGIRVIQIEFLWRKIGIFLMEISDCRKKNIGIYGSKWLKKLNFFWRKYLHFWWTLSRFIIVDGIFNYNKICIFEQKNCGGFGGFGGFGGVGGFCRVWRVWRVIIKCCD